MQRWIIELGGILLACLSPMAALAAPAKRPAEVPLKDFFSTPALSAVTLSPDGRQLAMVVPGPNGRRILVIAPADEPQRRKGLAQFKDADVSRVWWVNDKRLTFTVTDDRAPVAEQFGGGLYAIDADGENFIWLVGRGAGDESKGHVASRPLRANHRFRMTLRDGSDDVIVDRVHIFISDAKDAGSSSVMRLNTRTRGVTAMVSDEPRFVSSWAVDGSGSPKAALAVERDGKAGVLARTASGWEKIADFELYDAKSSSIYPVGALNDGRLLVRAVQGGEGRTWGLYTLDPATRKLSEQAMLSVQGFDWDPETGGYLIYDRSKEGAGRLAGAGYTSDAPGVRWFLPALNEVQRRVDALLPNTNNIVRCDPCGGQTRFVVIAEADRQPAVFFLFDASEPDAKALRLIGASKPEIDAALMATMDLSRVTARDGKSMPVWVTRPKGKGPFPTVVLVHGGPWVRGAQWGWRADAQFLASRGYLVVEPEFRGSRGYGDAWFRASFKQWGQAMQDDVTDATLWAVKQGLADEKRLVIAGASYGGYATMMGLVKEPELYRAGVNWVGVTDVDLMYSIGWSDSNDVWKKLGMAPMVGDQDKDKAMLQRYSPLLRAAEIRRPVLMAYGGEDYRVPLPHGTKMRDALLNAGKVPVEWVEYELEGHGFRQPANLHDFWGRVERFLATHTR